MTGLSYLKDIVRQHEEKEIHLEVVTMRELERVIGKVEAAYSRLGVDLGSMVTEAVEDTGQSQPGDG